MIEQIFYAVGIVFFFIASSTIVKCYSIARKLYNKMEDANVISSDSQKDEVVQKDEVALYRQRLCKDRVKTEEDLAKMSDKDVKQMYLKQEQKIIDDMGDKFSRFCVKAWSLGVSRVLPIDDQTKLENDLNNDVFVKAMVKHFFPAFYYDYGTYIAPVSVLGTTATHIDLTDKIVEINGRENCEKSQEDQADED